LFTFCKQLGSNWVNGPLLANTQVGRRVINKGCIPLSINMSELPFE